MYRLKPIRKSRRLPRSLFAGANLAFWIMLGVAFLVGGGRAISGIPSLASAILPHGVVAAQASDAPRDVGVSIRVALGELPPSKLAPRVLFPVVSHPPPDWRSVSGTRDVASASILLTSPPGIAPKVAIVIDDLGPDLLHSDRAIALPSAITLSILPYATSAPAVAANAERHGHEVLLHEPMQAVGGEYPGPLELRSGLLPDEIRRRLAAAVARVPGAVGINNHMGSAFTADREALIPVAEELAARHLLFFDSRTTPNTKVVSVAHAFGVASAERDVFLDDDQSADGVKLQLEELELRARRQGVAIAIGHPHDVTLAAVAEWCARARSRGFVLVPISEAIRLKTEYAARLTLAEAK
jgi:hypothetical protein